MNFDYLKMEFDVPDEIPDVDFKKMTSTGMSILTKTAMEQMIINVELERRLVEMENEVTRVWRMVRVGFVGTCICILGIIAVLGWMVTR